MLTKSSDGGSSLSGRRAAPGGRTFDGFGLEGDGTRVWRFDDDDMINEDCFIDACFLWESLEVLLL